MNQSNTAEQNEVGIRDDDNSLTRVIPGFSSREQFVDCVHGVLDDLLGSYECGRRYTTFLDVYRRAFLLTGFCQFCASYVHMNHFVLHMRTALMVLHACGYVTVKCDNHAVIQEDCFSLCADRVYIYFTLPRHVVVARARMQFGNFEYN